MKLRIKRCKKRGELYIYIAEQENRILLDVVDLEP